MSDPNTIAIYDDRAADYAAMTDDWSGGRIQRNLVEICAKGGRVLDLGCGPGQTAAAMAKAGLTVDAMDASGEMVMLANKHPGVTAWQATFDDLDAEAVYDAIVASFSLLHASRADFPRHLAAIHRALKPRGLFSIGMKLGDDAARDTIGRFYTYYSEAELDTYLTDAGFTPIDRSHGSGAGLDGTTSDWIVILSHA